MAATPNARIIQFQFFILVILFSSSGFLYLDTIKLCSSNHNNNNVSCSDMERKALLNFKDGLIDPSGRLSSWVGTNCCTWPGVVCSSGRGHVVMLKLGNSHQQVQSDDDGSSAYALGGQISASLLDLKYLIHLDLSMNNFAEIPIPDFVGSLEALRYLNLSGSSFLAPLPPSLGNLSRLQYLDLSSNFMESYKIELNWLPGLSSLKHLNIGNVNLSMSGSIWLETVNMLPSLSQLHLPYCGLPVLPLSLPRINFTSLSVLDLSNNGFYTSMPPWLFNLTSLVYVDLSSNILQTENLDEFSKLSFLEHLDLTENSLIGGRLTRNLGLLCNLHVLDLSFNGISGDLNDFISGLSGCKNGSLERLHLGDNKLGGSLPDSLGNVRTLKYLYLMENSFSGSIPQSIGNLSSLKEFNLHGNQMRGSIPDSLGQLSSLEVLEISENQWHGTITETHFSNLTSLKQLNIMQSQRNFTLFFDINPEWLPPFKLTYIDLEACLIGPQFPNWLRNQNMLNHVAVWYAKIAGTIPDWFWELDLLLDYIDFSYNQLSGTLPSTIRFREQAIVFFNSNNFTGPLPVFSSNVSSYHLDNNFFTGPIPRDFGERMPLLGDLDISYNSLSGEIPLSMGNLSYLFTLVLASNNLTGKIPEIWETMPFVYLIDVTNNNLSGNLPSSIGSLSLLKFLRLSNNNLSGELPSALQNCTLIESLDLGNNKFLGNIPTWIGEKMPSVLIISLRSNLFTGEIPHNLCNLSSLHILDLAQNRLSGHIPICIGNLIGMTTVVESKRYEGQLSVVVKGRLLMYDGTLFLVNVIDISSNNLSGQIPELKNLSRLVTLNLSRNHLTGLIPTDVGNLRWLETLDLSSNNLSGSIPTSMISMTSLNHLNLSHNNLSGKIPTANQFQTLNDPSIYEGNLALCGLPLPTKCGDDSDGTSEQTPPTTDDDDEERETLWFYVSMAIGFVVGFWGVCGILILNKSWRHGYFRFIDGMKDWVVLVFNVKLGCLRNLFGRKRT